MEIREDELHQGEKNWDQTLAQELEQAPKVKLLKLFNFFFEKKNKKFPGGFALSLTGILQSDSQYLKLFSVLAKSRP